MNRIGPNAPKPAILRNDLPYLDAEAANRVLEALARTIREKCPECPVLEKALGEALRGRAYPQDGNG